MCFRPPAAQKPVKCPACGALNPGMVTKCVKCKADLSETKKEEDK